MARLASGTPPNGNEKRSASTSGAPPAGRAHASGRSARRARQHRGERRTCSWRRCIRAAVSCHIHTHPRRQPSEAERSAGPEPGSSRRRGTEGDLEQRDADERQRPPSPRRQRERDQRNRPRARAPVDSSMHSRAGRASSARRCARGWSPAGGRRTTWPSCCRSDRRSGWRPARRSRSRPTEYTKRPANDVVKITSSPGTSWSRWRKSWLWLTRCPATTTLPTSPGIAEPGQWPGPWSSVASRMPSYSVAAVRSRGSRSCRSRRVAPSSRPPAAGRRAPAAGQRRRRSWSGPAAVVVGAWSASVVVVVASVVVVVDDVVGGAVARGGRRGGGRRRRCRARQRWRATVGSAAGRAEPTGAVATSIAGRPKPTRTDAEHRQVCQQSRIASSRPVEIATTPPRLRPGRCRRERRCRGSWHRRRAALPAGPADGGQPSRWCGRYCGNARRPAGDADSPPVADRGRGGGRPRSTARSSSVVVVEVVDRQPVTSERDPQHLAVAPPVGPLLRAERHRRDRPLHGLGHEVAAAAVQPLGPVGDGQRHDRHAGVVDRRQRRGRTREHGREQRCRRRGRRGQHDGIGAVAVDRASRARRRPAR